jgi:hypothetical protein
MTMPVCDVCNSELKEKEGYLLTTTQVVRTPGYWRKALSDMGALGAAFGVSQDAFKIQFAQQMASQTNPWMVCGQCIGIFSVDRNLARQHALQWYQTGGTFAPPGTGPASLSDVNMGDGKRLVQGGSAEAIALAPQLKAMQQQKEERVGGLGVYFLLLFGGLGLGVLGAALRADRSDLGGIFLALGVIAVCAAQILFIVRFYQAWRHAIAQSNIHGLTPSIQTPGKAIGYCFIPFFNLYWMFKAFGTLPKDLNAIAAAEGSRTRMSVTLGFVLPALALINFLITGLVTIGYVSWLVTIFMVYPIYISHAARMCKPGEAALEELESTHDLLALFGKDPLGVGLYVGLGMVVSGLISSFLLEIINSLINESRFFFVGYQYSVVWITADIVRAGLFVILCSVMRKKWILVLLFAAGNVLLGIGIRAMLNAMQSEGVSVQQLFLVRGLIFGFSWGLLFATGLFLSVHYWGPKIWSLILATSGVTILQNVAIQLYLVAENPDAHFALAGVVAAAVDGAVLGALIHLGFAWHAKRRGSRTAHPEPAHG